MAFKFGDFVKADREIVARVFRINDNWVYVVCKAGGVLRKECHQLTSLPDYVDFDGPIRKFYRHKTGFVGSTKFVSRVGDSWAINGIDCKRKWSYAEDRAITDGLWIEITEAEAMALLEPKYVPWTFETMPDSVKVQLKSEKERKRVARPWTTRSACVSGTLTYYAGLLEEYEQLDGSPCGQLQEGK